MERDTLFRTPEPDEKLYLASSTFKTVYVHPGNPTKVILVMTGPEGMEDLRDEAEMLRRLKEEFDIAAPQIDRLGWVEMRDGRNLPAAVQSRFAVAEKCEDRQVQILQKVLGHRTRESLSHVLRMLDRHRLYVDDLQFGFNSDGGALVIDPRALIVGETEEGFYLPRQHFQRLEWASFYCEAIRSRLAEPPPNDLEQFWKRVDDWMCGRKR